MVFKERKFHQVDPSDEQILPAQVSASAAQEAEIADFLASLPNLDATQISVVVDRSSIVLSGFAASREEAQRAAAAALQIFPRMTVDNRLQVG